MSDNACPEDPSQPVQMAMRAAAISYRRSAEGIEFLLVRTRNRRAWTFPKGHIERGESPVQAARREAKEEAGVSGRIETTPFTRYRLPAWRAPGLAPTEVCVEAFLMEVEAPRRRGTAERAVGWFAPPEAARRLAESRSPDEAREHARVIAEAVARVSEKPPADGSRSDGGEE